MTVYICQNLLNYTIKMDDNEWILFYENYTKFINKLGGILKKDRIRQHSKNWFEKFSKIFC